MYMILEVAHVLANAVRLTSEVVHTYVREGGALI